MKPLDSYARPIREIVSLGILQGAAWSAALLLIISINPLGLFDYSDIFARYISTITPYQDKIPVFLICTLPALIAVSVKGTTDPLIRALFTGSPKNKTLYYKILKNRAIFITFIVITVTCSYFTKNTDHQGTLLLFSVVLIITSVYIIYSTMQPPPHQVRPKEVPATFLEDTPQTANLSKDQLILGEKLKNIIKSGKPGSVSITGPWGSGKSSILRYARQDAPSNILWVDFEPWTFTSEESLVLGFFTAISDRLELHRLRDWKVSRSIIQSAQALVSTSSSGIDLSKISNPTTEDIGTTIRNILDRENIRIIITIEDIERQLDPTIIHRTLQLAHHAGRIDHRVQTILLYEGSEVLAKLNEKDRFYLEKFSEINLSTQRPTPLDLSQQFKHYARQPHIKQILGDFNQLPNLYLSSGASFRTTILIINDILLESDLRSRSNSRGVQKEYVNGSDAFMMNFIKLKYPYVFDDIFHNRQFYTNSDYDIDYYLEEEDERRDRITKHITALVEMYGNVAELPYIKSTLLSLFPLLGDNTHSNRMSLSEVDLYRNRRISHPAILNAYFNLSTATDSHNLSLIEDLTHNVINSLITIEEYLTEILSSNIANSAGPMLTSVIRDTSQVDALDTLRGIFHGITNLEPDGFEAHDGSLDGLLISILSLADELIQIGDSESALSNRFFDGFENKTANIYYSLYTLLILLPERNNHYFSEYISRELSRTDGNSLYDVVLRSIDERIIDNGINIYKSYPRKWPFVAHQWSHSVIASTRDANSRVDLSHNRMIDAERILTNNLNALTPADLYRLTESSLRKRNSDTPHIEPGDFSPVKPINLKKALSGIIDSRTLIEHYGKIETWIADIDSYIERSSHN